MRFWISHGLKEGLVSTFSKINLQLVFWNLNKFDLVAML